MKRLNVDFETVLLPGTTRSYKYQLFLFDSQILFQIFFFFGRKGNILNTKQQIKVQDRAY